MDFITIVGVEYYFGSDIFRVDQKLWLEKDKDNEKDEEAIKVVTESKATLGYVANSVYTKAKGTKSAGRIYDSFEDMKQICVRFVVGNKIIAELL